MPLRAGEACSSATSGAVLIYPLTCSPADPQGAADIIDCLLFPKFKFQDLRTGLAVLISRKPTPVSNDDWQYALDVRSRFAPAEGWGRSSLASDSDPFAWVPFFTAAAPYSGDARFASIVARAKECWNWCLAMSQVIAAMADATNIAPEFIFGGYAPRASQDWTSRIPSAASSLFPSFNAQVLSLPSSQYLIGWPMMGAWPGATLIGQPPPVDAIAPSPLPPLWPPDFSQPRAALEELASAAQHTSARSRP
jgi:hypothetical protein